MSAQDKEFPNFVTHLECSMNGERFEAAQVHGLSSVGRPLLVRYDLEGLAKSITKEALAARTGGFWRYREFLPVTKTENVVDLGEVMTPLISLQRMASKHGAGAKGRLIV